MSLIIMFVYIKVLNKSNESGYEGERNQLFSCLKRIHILNTLHISLDLVNNQLINNLSQ